MFLLHVVLIYFIFLFIYLLGTEHINEHFCISDHIGAHSKKKDESFANMFF